MAVYGDDNDNSYYADALPTIYAGDGDDTVGSGGGFLLAYGGNGADTLYQNGTGGLDAFGGYGNDYLIALNSTNSCFLYGDEGSDIVIGGTLSDYLDGGRGTDCLRGGAGNDRIYGGEDDDGIVTITAGAPRGSFSVSRTAGLYGEAGNDYIDGGAGDDDIFGGTDDDALYGGDGSDFIRGDDGVDYLDGGRGGDVLNGGLGADRMIGGDESDLYFVDNAADAVIESAGGGIVDEVDTSISYALDAQAEIERLYVYDYSRTDDLNLTGNDFSQDILGNAGKNTLNGLGGSDTLDGYLGADIMIGGLGSDTYTVDNAGDRCIEVNGQGSDSVLASISYSLAGQFIEKLTLTGTGNISATGNSQANALTGNAGMNVLNGMGGADVMAGLGGSDTYYVDNAADRVIEADGQGTDIIYASVSYSLAGQFIESLTLTGTGKLNATGNSQANTLTGNSSANILNGFAGADTLAGGIGTDTFVFSTALGSTNVDHITDFSAADDTIQLSKAIFTALSGGTLAPGAFKDLSSAMLDADDRILYNKTTGSLAYDADGSGTKAAVKFAVIDTKVTLTASDFFIVS